MIPSTCDASYGGLALLFKYGMTDTSIVKQSCVCIAPGIVFPTSLRFIYGSLKCEAHNLGSGNFGGSSIRGRVRNVVKLGERIALQSEVAQDGYGARARE